MMRYLSTGADFKTTGDAQINISKSTIHRCLWECVDFVYYNHERYIRWPQTPDEQREKALLYDVDRFGNKPFCIGAADCMHVGIKKPSYHWQEEAFVNRKSFHSINVLVRNTIFFIFLRIQVPLRQVDIWKYIFVHTYNAFTIVFC